MSVFTVDAPVVGIFGLGYVGIPLAGRVSEVGLKVVGFDVDQGRIDKLNAASSPFGHITDADIASMRSAGFEAVSDFSRARECDALIICVPTPLDKARDPDLSFVEATMAAIQPHFRAGQFLCLESTTWPGTTNEVLRPYIEAQGLEIGKDFFLGYSPEREDPGNPKFGTQTIPKVVGGDTKACLDVGVALYRRFIDQVVPVSSTATAELVKLVENIHRSVNIGLVNELKIVADRMGLDIFEVIDAAKSKPFGFTAFYPGPGIGGHCIPIDPFYLTWKAREYGMHTRFIELAGEINADMPDYVVNKTIWGLNKQQKSLSGAKVLALGIAYKKNVDDMRESPSLFVMEKLNEWGALVDYSDPHIPVFTGTHEYHFEGKSVELTPETISSYDAVILLTEHFKFDYGVIAENASLLIDTRGVYRGEKWQHLKNVVQS